MVLARAPDSVHESRWLQVVPGLKPRSIGKTKSDFRQLATGKRDLYALGMGPNLKLELFARLEGLLCLKKVGAALTSKWEPLNLCRQPAPFKKA